MCSTNYDSPKKWKEDPICNAIQEGSKKGRALLCGMPMFKEGNNSDLVLDGVKRVLQEFQNVMPEQLPKVLPPKRTVDYKIELLPKVKPPTKGTIVWFPQNWSS